MTEPEVTPRSVTLYPRHRMYLLDDYSSEGDSDDDVKPAWNNEIVKSSKGQQSTTKAGSAKEDAVTSDSTEKEISKSMIDHPSNERSGRRLSKSDRIKNIELYCVKCDNISRPKTIPKRARCRLCKIFVTYQCKICKKRYTHRESVYNHLRYECLNDEPQYKCSQCDYKAKQKGNLRRHVKLKHSIKKCTGCGKNFKDSFALKKQQQKCSNKRMLKCYCCSHNLRSKTQLEKHIRLEHSSRYMCSQCGKKYTYLKHLKNHQKNGCGSEIHYECNHCSYSTNKKNNLRRHIKSQHSEIFLFEDLL